ncbi:MAG TPA: glycine--tRNA ligase subunit beta [Gaiellaceae bacterium]|nr:glycine--tRNA ligase subunit beta [Gaiellaceae bacterium]
MPRLIFEIGCEELPALACREAEAQLPELCRRLLGTEPDRVYIGPRRLVIAVDDLPERGEDQVKRGPAERMAFDDDGKPTKAAEGFARGAGVAVDELERRDGHIWAHVAGESVVDTLPERLPQIVRGLAFTKSMKWEADGLRFARPIRWLVAKVGKETVEASVDGLAVGTDSFGHRWIHPGAVPIKDAARYEDVLRKAGVEPDETVRREEIVAALDQIGGWEDPGGKLDEVVFLVERPHVLEGAFAERFLELPERVIVTAMQSHQRYFPLGGRRVAIVANAGDPEIVRGGHIHVLESRLADATFTFERDAAVGIEGLVGRLGSIVFVRGGGSFADKSARLRELVDALGGGDASREAARLAKADQAAELVREFPELEGYIGGEYARLAGFPEAVCAAIEEQYLPDASGGPLPSTEPGKTLAAADKVDTLTVAFALGQKPSGSRDPYALRRAAIGLCRLALEGELRLEIAELVAVSHKLLLAQAAEVGADFDPAEVADFVAERLEKLLDVPVEYVRAARGSTLTELGGVARLALALAALDSGKLVALHTAYARSDRLAKDAEGAVDPTFLQEPAEQAVWETLQRVEAEITPRVEGRDFDGALTVAAELGPPLDRFFDEVLVMAEDSAVRANRLRLLAEVRETLRAVGDLSELPL